MTSFTNGTPGTVEEIDELRTFLTEMTRQRDGARTSRQALYTTYRRWHEERGARTEALSARRFTRLMLHRLHLIPVRYSGLRFWLDVALRGGEAAAGPGEMYLAPGQWTHSHRAVS
jgi:hypothetical protein